MNIAAATNRGVFGIKSVPFSEAGPSGKTGSKVDPLIGSVVDEEDDPFRPATFPGLPEDTSEADARAAAARERTRLARGRSRSSNILGGLATRTGSSDLSSKTVLGQ